MPDGIDDPARPSGGNIYDRKVIHSLSGSGWHVHEHTVGGQWPRLDESSHRALAQALGAIPDGATVVIDGLLASCAARVVVPAAARLRLAVLMHLPLGHSPPGHELPHASESERAVLTAAGAIVATSDWTRGLLLQMYDELEPHRVHVAAPGVDRALQAEATPLGGSLLCVAAVTRHKGHDLLLAALSALTDLAWHCTCVGALDQEPAFAADLRHGVESARLSDRITFTGAVVGAGLERFYAAADLLLLPSRGETHGMVVTEALAHGIPVIATAVGGVPDTIGYVEHGRRPGLLVPPEDSAALAAAIRRWLGDESLRAAVRDAAGLRRSTLPSWSATAAQLGGVIASMTA